jgi:hypothetical protein
MDLFIRYKFDFLVTGCNEEVSFSGLSISTFNSLPALRILSCFPYSTIFSQASIRILAPSSFVILISSSFRKLSQRQYEETRAFLERQEAANAQPRAANVVLKAWQKGLKYSKRREQSLSRSNWGHGVGDGMYIA